MTDHVVETATITLRQGVTEQELLEASETLQTGFLQKQPGFLRRELLKQDQRNFLDLVHWRSQRDAENGMLQAETSSDCAAFFSLMEINEENPSEGVIHYRSIAVYADE